VPQTLDLTLDDPVTVAELRLVTELIVVAAQDPDALEPDVIDRVLGIESARRTFPEQRGAE
jgi:hypothetical protein